MLTWRRLQEENKRWVEKNFGDKRWPIDGMVEELGEFSHARLKMRQGIRGTTEQHIEDQKDALADGIIFLADLCTLQGWHLAAIAKSESPEEFQKTFTTPPGVTPTRHMLCGLADTYYWIERINNLSMEIDGPSDSVQELHGFAQEGIHKYLSGVSSFCIQQKWSMQELVQETWYKVRQRDWTKNKENGDAAAINVGTDVENVVRAGDEVTLTLKPGAPKKKP